MQKQIWLCKISEAESNSSEITINQSTTYPQLIEYAEHKLSSTILKIFLNNGDELTEDNIKVLKSGDIIKALTV